MKSKLLITSMLVTLLSFAAIAEEQSGEEINWQVISSGGTKGASTNYQVNGTIGQTAVGAGASTNYGVRHGYWQDFGAGGASCCNHDGIRGDVNYNLGGPNVADLTYLVDFLFRAGPAPPCLEEADVNGDLAGPNVADLTYLVDYLFRGGLPPAACHQQPASGFGVRTDWRMSASAN